MCHIETLRALYIIPGAERKAVVEGNKLEIHSQRSVTRKKPVAKK